VDAPGIGWAQRYATRDYRKLIQFVEGERTESPMPGVTALRARLAVVLAESGRWQEALVELDGMVGPAAEMSAFRRMLQVAYGSVSIEAVDLQQLERAKSIFEDPALPPAGVLDPWLVDRLSVRVYERAGEQTLARALSERIYARAVAAWRAARMALSPFLLVACGLVVGAIDVARRRFPREISPGIIQAPWGMRGGLWILTRAALGGVFMVVVAHTLQRLLGLRLSGHDTLLLLLPMVILLRASLRAHGLSPISAFGLSLTAPSVQLMKVSLVLIGVEQAIGWAVVTAASMLGITAATNETIIPGLVLAPLSEAIPTIADSVVVAPVLEELAFRGILYTTLRASFGPGRSAFISAFAFAILHVPSLVAAVTLFAVGLLSALFYERTRSLWPCVIAHSFNNAWLVSRTVLLYG
jgi:membrane protease YdiL (CAAX protease family)